VATGQVIGRCHQRHRHQEFLQFLDQIDQTIPEEPGVEIPLVMDNDATHKTPRVKRWLARRPQTADADLILGRVANVCQRINNSGR